jgi:hypothetical protein
VRQEYLGTDGAKMQYVGVSAFQELKLFMLNKEP